MAAHDEGPADLDLAAFGFVAVVTTCADQPAGRSVDEHKAHFRIDRTVEVLPESGLGVAIADRMHLPDFRIGAGGEQFRPVVQRDRPDHNGGADQCRLKIWIGHSKAPRVVAKASLTKSNFTNY